MNSITERVLAVFEEINAIPRCSGNEKAISEWLLAWARDRGIQAGAIVLEASTFGDAPASLFLIGALASCAVPSMLVKRGDQLERTLSNSARWGGRG